MKIIYRILILAAVFVGSLVYFGANMPEVVNSVETGTTEMSGAMLPVVSMSQDSIEMNPLHGYVSEIDAALMRESITLIDREKTLDVLITENENTIKKFIYELSDTDGTVIENGTINALERLESGRKSVKIRLQADLEQGGEYLLTMTLVNSQSRKYYFYTRVKMYGDAHLAEQIEFVTGYHQAMFSKEEAEEYRKFMESKSSSDTTTLSYVNIYSSFDLMTWGELAPEKVTEPVPAVTELYADVASIALEYIVSAKTGSGTEEYYVKECFRVKYTAGRMYLLNYERRMEAVFDPGLLSLSKGEFKLGITSDTDVPYLLNKAGNMVSFVRNRELWYYNFSENTMVNVFAFRENGSHDIRDTYDSHDVRLLNMDEDGNIDFMVYGYMNRGEYEGRIALLLYRYYRVENRIEEQMYIPLNQPWQALKEEVGQLCYRNSLDIFYFTLYGTLYSYDLTAKRLTVIAEELEEDSVVYSARYGYAAWDAENENGISSQISVLNLDTGEIRSIQAPEDSSVKLLGEIDENMICGYARATDITYQTSGSRIVPMYKVTIVSPELSVLKDYAPRDGLYVTGARVDGSVITLEQMERSEKGYLDAPTDSIQNQGSVKKEAVSVTERVTDLTLTEYYLALPEGFPLTERPAVTGTVNTVIAMDTTVRAALPEEQSMVWYAAAYGEILGKYKTAGAAVTAADQAAGTVLDINGKIIWERGVLGSRAELITDLVSSGSSVEACAQMLFSYNKVEVDTKGMSLADGSLAGAVEQYLKAEFLDLSGASLDEVLYYVYKNAPVIAFRDDSTAVLITGYDTANITYLDPKAGRTVKMEKTEAAKLFEKHGNLFFSYRN